MSFVARWLRTPSGLGDGRRARKRRPGHTSSVGLGVEALEDRSMPSILFSPQFGGESVTDHGGTKLSSVPVELIFWGSAWGTIASPSPDMIRNALGHVLGGPYFSSLRQYGCDGNISLGASVFNTSNPSNGFTEG